MLQWHSEDTEWKGPANKVANNLLKARLSPLSNERNYVQQSPEQNVAAQKENQRDALGAFLADGIQNRTISIISEEQLKAREKEHTSVKVKKNGLCSGSRIKKEHFFYKAHSILKQTNGPTKHKFYSTSTSSHVWIFMQRPLIRVWSTLFKDRAFTTWQLELECKVFMIV